MKKVLLLLLCVFVYGCGVIDKRTSPVYFGGEIVNPTSPYLVLFKDDQVIDSAKITLKKVDAVALSMGPGSYTGLRIGTSTAKGLCYALDIPLIAISTLKAMAFAMAKNEKSAIYCPMIDARRMEVFSALYDVNNKQLRGVQADVVDENTYVEFLSNEIIFFGDGSLKCQEIINHKNAKFILGINPSAKNLGILAKAKFENKDFEDVAYFEPYYLKDFVAGKKKA